MAKDKPNGNNNDTDKVLAALRRMQEESNERLQKMQEESDERFGELEEQMAKKGDGADRVQLVKLFYETDDKHILELSNISPASVRPFATAITLGSILKPQVQRGDVSLSEIQIINYLRLRRSAYGKHFGFGVKALEEQMATTNQPETETKEW